MEEFCNSDDNRVESEMGELSEQWWHGEFCNSDDDRAESEMSEVS